MDLGLRGDLALITGASQGIGAGIAEVLAEEGCRLRLTARNGQNLEDVASDLRERFGADVEILAADLMESQAISDLAGWAGPVDILINNAGTIVPGFVTDVGDEEWANAFGLKFLAAATLTRLLYPGMKARGKGVILNNIGILAESPDSSQVVGSCVCAALEALTRSVGGASLDDGIRVIGVSPGVVATPLLQGFFDEDGAAQFPGKRAASVREVAEFFAFLASSRASYSSGTVVTMDGGLSARSPLSG